MTYQDALETVVAQTGHERFRELCHESHPDHAAWRLEVIRQATGGPEPKPAGYPSLLTQAGNAMAAAGRFIASGGAMAGQAEYDRRRAICAGCEFLDVAQDRCQKCGCCLAVKPWMAREHCPIGRW